METIIHSVSDSKLVSIYGYCSKSVPGIEINGLGKYGRAIKEKIVYVTRTRQLQIPLRRFVINVEFQDEKELTIDNVKWLELAIMIQYWELAGVIEPQKNILAVGTVAPSGTIETHPDHSLLLKLGNTYGLNLASTEIVKRVSQIKIEYPTPAAKLDEEELPEGTLQEKWINPIAFKCLKADYDLIAQHISNLRLMIELAEKNAKSSKKKTYDVEVSAFLETY